MSDILKKSALALACGLAFSAAAQAADVTISNGTLSAGINDGGTFRVGPAALLPGSVGAGDGPGLSWGGREFVNIDNAASWWWLSTNLGDTEAKYNSNPLGSTTTAGVPAGQAATTYAGGGLVFKMEWTVSSPDRLDVQLLVVNRSDAPLTGVQWGVGFDPDQGGSGKNTTFNRIDGQGHLAAVSATDTLYGTNTRVTLKNNTSAGAFDLRAFIGGDCCGSVDPGAVLGGAVQGVGTSILGDSSISLAYDFGTLAVGEAVTVGWSYVFAPIPEPETYAMLLAGLGLMGFIARRRKQNAA